MRDTNRDDRGRGELVTSQESKKAGSTSPISLDSNAAFRTKMPVSSESGGASSPRSTFLHEPQLISFGYDLE
jgi:hypothetical protein